MTHRADQFNVQDDVILVFQSKNKNYRLKLLIGTGLMILDELEGKKVINNRVFFIDDTRIPQEEENAENDHTDTLELENKKQSKKKEKKNANTEKE